MFHSIVIVFACISLVLTYWNIGAYDHFILQVVFPTCAAIMTFSAAIYSVKHKRNNPLRMLMYFMMLSSIAYMSAFSPNEAVYYIHSLSLLVSLSVLQHFVTGSVRAYVEPAILTIAGMLLLSEELAYVFERAFVVLAVLALSKLCWTLFRSRQQILLVCAFAYVPYVYLYLLPQVLLGEWWLSVPFASLSMMLISTAFIFTPFVELLLGKQIQFKKVRYYGYISMLTAVVIVLFVIPFLNDAHLAVLYFLLISVVLHIMLYVKEQLDFNARRFMVTSDQDMTQYLFQVIHRLSLCTSKQQLYALLEEELHRKYRATIAEEPNELMPLRLTRSNHSYRMPISKQQVVLFPHKRLSNEDIVWLELLFVYVDNFARSLDQIEVLMHKLEEQSSPWLNTLLFQMLEREKRSIAQELHDTVLQELLHLARTVEDLPVEQLREMLHEASFELREYCESLHPPLIESHGLKGAIDKLIQKTKLRADFLLHVYIEPVELANPLFMYRIIQELLNNAMKHAKAQNVKLSLYEENEVIIFHYEDDGIGLCEQVPYSMGLNGMQERVRAMQGNMLIEEQPYRVKIEIPRSKEA